MRVLSILTTILLVAGTRVPAQSRNTVLMPLSIGNSWTYEASWLDTLHQTHSQPDPRTFAIDSDTVILGTRWFRGTIESSWITQRPNGLWILTWQPVDSSEFDKTVRKSPLRPKEVFWLPYPPVDEFNHTLHGILKEVRDSTMLTTAAGTFKCIYYHFQDELRNTELWYAPNVGLIQSRSWGSPFASILQHSLVSFSFK